MNLRKAQDNFTQGDYLHKISIIDRCDTKKYIKQIDRIQRIANNFSKIDIKITSTIEWGSLLKFTR